jgi:methyltransferase (TIGR00027 family)
MTGEMTGFTAGPVAAGNVAAPDSTAVRTALWRALHVQIDAPPHVLEDEIGLRLADPDAGWRSRGDMDPAGTSRFRAGTVARSRVAEDLLAKKAADGVSQYVILGAGLDTYAQRQPATPAPVRVFEVDRPGPQAWKRERLTELGYGIPEWLRLVPVDFEAGRSWRDELLTAGFSASEPAVVASLGVSMYLSRDANMVTMRQVASLAAGSALVMTFAPPLDELDETDRQAREMAENGARASGAPWLSSFAPQELVELARQAGFTDARYISAELLNERYFAGRADGLHTSRGEEMLVAGTR